jgi:hypothetical protein
VRERGYVRQAYGVQQDDMRKSRFHRMPQVVPFCGCKFGGGVCFERVLYDRTLQTAISSLLSVSEKLQSKPVTTILFILMRVEFYTCFQNGRQFSSLVSL